MAIYKWNVEIRKNSVHRHTCISLSDLRTTLHTLKHDKKLRKKTNWTYTSIIPLIIEHIFMIEHDSVEEIGSIEIQCNDANNKFITRK